MNNKALVLLLTMYMGATAAHSHTGYLTFNFDSCYAHSYYNDPYYYNDDLGYDHHHYEHCLPSERNLRRQLYWLYLYNPRILEIKDFPVDYFIDTLTDHIKVLEHKIAAKQTGLRSGAMVRGTIFAAFAAVWGYAAHEAYKKSLHHAEEFGSVVILSAVSAILATLAGTQFDRVYRHAERLVERLERDKTICAVLER